VLTQLLSGKKHVNLTIAKLLELVTSKD